MKSVGALLSFFGGLLGGKGSGGFLGGGDWAQHPARMALMGGFNQQPYGEIQPGSPVYDSAGNLLPGSAGDNGGGLGINPANLPGPGSALKNIGPGGDTHNYTNDFRGSHIGADVHDVEKVVKDREATYRRGTAHLSMSRQGQSGS